MALQGTIETFALPDVMRLLASTKKTGRLRLSGSRGTGSVWVADGRLVAGEVSAAPHAQRPAEVVFELLRFGDGEFEFDADQLPDHVGEPADVDGVIDEAEAMVHEWRAIEAVVPSAAAWVSLRGELPADEVPVDRDRWRLIVAIGHGATVEDLAGSLDLGEMPASRQVKSLVDVGLADVRPEAPEGATASTRAAFAGVGLPDELEIESDLEPVGHVPFSTPEEGTGTNGSQPPLAAERFEGRATWFEAEEHDDVVEALPPPPPPPLPTAVGVDTDPGDAAEIARQLANLSPKAAKAVAAAAKATTQEERERALAEVDDTEDPINRELLIKFLGSVNG